MSSLYRENSMMAMLDAKPEAKEAGEYWNDVSDDHLSPIRKHLISTYLQVPDEEAMPLLGEYFGVALSFVALGALVRASNSSKKKQKKMSDEERLDLRSCSRFQRMALESMLKESMERLRNLSQNAFQLEERVRDLVDENVTQDKERVQLLQRLADTEKSVQELRALRKAEGRANERVMCIVAAKEQDWLKEKRSLQKEVEKLKESVSAMTREAKFQARRCRNPTCEHCKGIDRAVRNVRGRISLRELNSLKDPQIPPKREGAKVELIEEVAEEDKLLMKAIEHKKKQSERPGEPRNQHKVERSVEYTETSKTCTVRAQSGTSASGSGQSTSKELVVVKQQHDMESELANILKRVGMLKKQRSYLGSGLPPGMGGPATDEMQLPVDDREVPEPDQQRLDAQAEKVSNILGPNLDDPTFAVAEYTSDQEDYFSVGDEESDLVELERAFELRDDQETSKPQEENIKVRPELARLGEDSRRDAGSEIATDGHQQLLDEDAEFAAFERSLNLEEEFSLAELERERGQELLVGKDRSPLEAENSTASEESDSQEVLDLNEGLNFSKSETEVARENSGNAIDSSKVQAAEVLGKVQPATSTEDYQEANAHELQPTPDASMDMLRTKTDVEDIAESSSAGDEHHLIHQVAQSTDDQEQVLEILERDDTTDFADALSTPLDPITDAASEHRVSPGGNISKQPDQLHAEVIENWDFEDPEGGLPENQEIPLFERNNVDDLAAELPEPEEKRVCGSEIPDSSSTSGSTDEVPSTLEKTASHDQRETLKEKGAATTDGVESEQTENLFAGEKPKSEKLTEHAQGVAPADVTPISEG